MTARSYTMGPGREPVAVEVSGNVEASEVEAELRRIYGHGYRLGRWSRRGKSKRAIVEKVNDSDIVTRRVREERRAGGVS